MRLTLITLFSLSIGCTLNQYSSDILEEPTPEVIKYNYTQTEKSNVVDQVMKRWSNATCLDLERVQSGAPHSISFVERSELPKGLTGHTGGRPNAIRIRVANDQPNDWSEVLLMHEVFHHLAATNLHLQEGVASNGNNLHPNSLITEEVLNLVCEVRYCLCFNPEE